MAKKKTAAPAPDDDRQKKQDAVERHRLRAKERSREKYVDASDIGAIPKLSAKSKRLREKYRFDLEGFLVYCFPNSTGLKPFSEDHKKVIARMQHSILHGQDIWNCVFRGFAKTSIAIGAVIWALLYGHRKFILLLAANKTFAVNMLNMVKSALLTNPILYELFPEVCFPVRRMEGVTLRCNTQRCQGKFTHMMWREIEIRLPTIEGSDASAGICVAAGIDGAINGLVRSLPDGRNVRPDWWLADDLQTRKTARSPLQVANRVDALKHSVMMLGGHTSTIGGCVNGTLFKPNDVMQQLANPELFPSFSGEVVPMIKAFPKSHETFWLTDYARVLKAFDPKIPGDKQRAQNEATSLYKSRRKEADAGGVVTWEHAYKAKDGELSALQHAYNILILQGEEVFSTECQQQVYIEPGQTEQLTLEDVTSKLSGMKHREVPQNAMKLTCYIDIQHESLWYVVIAWTADFTGFVIDYGEWPDQGSRDVSKKNLKVSLSQKYKLIRNREARMRQAMHDLCTEILDRKYKDAEGREHSIDVCLADCRDGVNSESIRAWIRTCRWNKVMRAAMGRGLRASATPLTELPFKKGEEIRRGLNWIEYRDRKVKGGTIIHIDTNRWKTFTANRWRSGSPRPTADPSFRPNEPGALYLWGMDPYTHETFGHHQLSEWGDPDHHPPSGRYIDIWELKPSGKPDNERWDCVVNNCVAADYAGGITLKNSGLQTVVKKKKRRTKKATYLSL